MSIVSKKNASRDHRKTTADARPKPKVKNIGLDEKIEEANRLFRLLKNPELLKK
jgi:hypothetical protein